jgi:glyoxylase-like metal-dependent hydrolase (beta-lactamase superfamily II)
MCPPISDISRSHTFTGTMSVTAMSCERLVACANGRTGNHVRRSASPRTEPANFSALKNSKILLIATDEYDVFSDKTVVIKAAPGHSPGHQVLFLKLAKTGPIVLSGDLYHYPEKRKLNKIPTTEFNADQTIASRTAIEAFLEENQRTAMDSARLYGYCQPQKSA